jgi:beta-glucosidase
MRAEEPDMKKDHTAGPDLDPGAERRIESLLRKMALEEKVDLIGGTDEFYVRAVPRLGIPALRMSDGPMGIRCAGPSGAYAAGIALAASWDRDLAERVGRALGRDAAARGVRMLLGPGVNLCRSPLCGRNFEYFGEDPFLAARTAVAYIRGVQAEGVCAVVKHLAANNSEFDRHHSSSDMDERTLRELYLPAFEAAVKEAGVGAVMSSYNLVNGVHASQNGFLNNRILKVEWGFRGPVLSDWYSVYDGVAAALGGLDLEMPRADFMNRKNLFPALRRGRISPAVLDDKVRRILRLVLRFDGPGRGKAAPAWTLYDRRGAETALRSAESGMVLLQNKRGFLPFSESRVKTLAVLGPCAFPALPSAGGSARTTPFAPVSFLQGLDEFLGGRAEVLYHRGVAPLSEVFGSTPFTADGKGRRAGLRGEYFNNPEGRGNPAVIRLDSRVHFNWDPPQGWPGGALNRYSARWTGFFTPPKTGVYRLAAQAYGRDSYRLFLDGKKLMDRKDQAQPIGVKDCRLQKGRPYALRLEYAHDEHHSLLGFGVFPAERHVEPEALDLARRADRVVLCVGFDPTSEGEGSDRTFGLPQGQDELVRRVLEANPRTVLVLTSGGAVDMVPWVRRVPAILETWYAGQEAGRALARILFGKANPSGKLPISFDRRWRDNASYGSYYPDSRNRIRYREGVFSGYRHYDRARVKPLFPFGHGLSYTRFRYGGLRISPACWGGEGRVAVSFEVANRGGLAGAEAAQVYVAAGRSPLPRPVKELKGFAKVALKPGRKKRVKVMLDLRAFSYFDEGTGRWEAPPGAYGILVGSSSEKIELRGKIELVRGDGGLPAFQKSLNRRKGS